MEAPHATGCGRTEGFYKLGAKVKKQIRHQRLVDPSSEPGTRNEVIMMEFIKKSVHNFLLCFSPFKTNEPGAVGQEPPQRAFRCLSCEFRCYSKEGLKKHIQGHFISTAFDCELCSYSANSAKRLANHLQLDHKNKLRSRMAWNIPHSTTALESSIPSIARLAQRFLGFSKTAVSGQRPFICDQRILCDLRNIMPSA